MEETKDRRIRKTKAAIHRALMTLMEKKRIEEITVLELTEQADINRKTFYNHYPDIFAVLDEVEDECIDRFLTVFEEEDVTDYINDAVDFFVRLITQLQESEEVYLLLSQTERHSHLMQKLISREKKMLHRLINTENMNETMIDYFLNFISTGTSSVIRAWFLSDQKISVQTLARFFSLLFTSSDMRHFLEIFQADE